MQVNQTSTRGSDCSGCCIASLHIKLLLLSSAGSQVVGRSVKYGCDMRTRRREGGLTEGHTGEGQRSQRVNMRSRRSHFSWTALTSRKTGGKKETERLWEIVNIYKNTKVLTVSWVKNFLSGDLHCCESYQKQLQQQPCKQNTHKRGKTHICECVMWPAVHHTTSSLVHSLTGQLAKVALVK